MPAEHVWEKDDNYAGPGALRDLMISRSDSEWILPLDDTDTLDPDHLEIALRNSDDADILYTWCRVENGHVYNRLFNPKALIRFNYIPVTALIKRDMWEKVGGFEDNNPHRFWLKCLKEGARFKCVPEVTWTMRPQEARLWDLSIRRGALQKPGELRQLVELIQSRPAPKVVLEIGTARGGTLWLWCQLADPNAFIISIDLPGGAFGGGYEEADIPRLITMTEHQQKMQLFRGDSHDPNMFKATKRVLDGRQVDLLFIDGDHTYGGVKKDYETYASLVKPGGLICFHDISKHFYMPEVQVRKYWDEVKEGKDYREIITEIDVPWMMTHELDRDAGKDWGGIGVIFT